MDWCEIGHGWSCDANITTWMEVTWHGYRWDMKPRTWIEVRQYMDGGEIRILKFGCRWNKTCITRINPVRWNLTWMKVRCESRDLDGVRQDMNGGKMHILRPGWGEIDHGWSWAASLATWMEIRPDLDGGEIKIAWPGRSGGETRWGWRGDATVGNWMEVRRDLDGGKAHILRPEWVWFGPGLSWFVFFLAWMEERKYIEGADARILRPGSRWDKAWI